MNDQILIREYADRNSESAFADLVEQHIHLVYSVAFRYVGNAADAQDVTQSVFIILARKAGGLRQRTTLTGWLYETARFTAAALLRSKVRQRIRDQEAYMQSTLKDSIADPIWQQLAPLLEEAMGRLNEKERTLLALRLFDNKTAAQTAALLGIRPDAAHKRMARALEKLRRFFLNRGIDSSTTLIAQTISFNAIQAAPLELARPVIAAAMVKGAAATGSTLALIKGALKMMFWSKAKPAVIAGLAVLLAVGAGTVAIQKIQGQTHESQRQQFLNRLGPVIKISPNGVEMTLPARGSSQLGISSQPNGMPANENVMKLRISGNALRRSKAIWADREFVEINDEGALRNAISALTEPLSLDADAKAAANETCYRLLSAYSSGNWDLFKSVRIPSTNYVVNTHMLQALPKQPAGQATTVLDQYQVMWEKSFARRGLFDEVSFVADSVGVFDLAVDRIPRLGFPTFTAATNQNWVTLSPPRIFDYGQTELRNLDKAEVLRFFFFGKTGNDVNLYDAVFVWDKNESTWLPSRMTVACAGPLEYTLPVF